MAKKKPTPPPSDEGPKRRRRSRPGPESSPEFPIGLGSPSPSSSPNHSARRRKTPLPTRTVPPELDNARELAVQAAGALDPKLRIVLAKRAVETSPDCAEGYILLAEHAKTRKAALALYEKAVAAASRVLGPEIFDNYKGQFWGLIETRPYMRARLGLAEALWASGRRQEAAEHVEAMLGLNPDDNQGLRYIQAGWLLNLDRFDELDDLLGRKPIPPEQPEFYVPGDEDDAILYVGHNLSAWKSAPGAIGWVRSKEKGPRKRRLQAPATVGPSPTVQERLRSLPSEMDAWQADFRQFARRVEIAGERVRPWMVLVSSRTRDLVLAHALTDQPPSPEELWDIVASAMESPAAGEPHRPTELQVRPGGHWDALAGHFEAIGVACSPTEVLDQVDYLFDDLSRHMAGVDPPGLLDMPGVTPEQVGRLYDAAAAFYRRAPWRSLGYEAVIRIECDRYQSGPWFAIIMGQSGLTLGLALYEDLALLRRMWAGKLTDEEGARRTVALTLTFDDEGSMPEADLEAIERHGWTIAEPEAYPSIFRKERGLSMRPPLSWEIDLMDACLRVLPDFVDRRPADDPTRELVPVPGAVEPMELGLSWIEEPV